MTEPTRRDATVLLAQLRDGDADAGPALFALLYDELRVVAGRCMANERRHHTLQPTELVHEVWLRSLGGTQGPLAFDDRRHFIRAAARAMRHVLVDHARARSRAKRGSGGAAVPLDAVLDSFTAADVDVIELHNALETLEAMDASMARLVELRYFAGLTVREAADVHGVPLTRAERSLRIARMWFRKRFGEDEDEVSP